MKFTKKGFQKRFMVLAVMAIISIMLAGCSGSSSTQDAGAAYIQMDTISVSGFGEAVGKPDIALLQLGVSVVADQVGKAMEESNQVMQDLTQALRDATSTYGQKTSMTR
jgi:uncharacterized protein YggE